MLCPCKTGLNYKNCCEPFHHGALPKTALQLMRSRYSAYALHLPDYIVATTHPDNPSPPGNISEFCLNTQFVDLAILAESEELPFATVTFRAHLTQGGRDASFTEKSLFENVQGKWLYLDRLE